MPGRSVHVKVDRMLLKRPHPRVHRMLDLPHLWMGERHRRLFHDPLTAMMVGYAVDGPEGGLSALLHVMTDKLLSGSR